MNTVIWSLVSYAHDGIMLFMYFSGTLGRKHSLKWTAAGTCFWYMAVTVPKIMAALFIGNDFYSNLAFFFSYMALAVYIAVFYTSSAAKKFLAAVLIMAALGCMEMLTFIITTTAMRGGRPLEMNARYTELGLLIMRPLSMLGFCLSYLIWKLLMRSRWIKGGRLWLCVILPLSQSILLWYISTHYLIPGKTLPLVTLLGLFLGILADVCMYGIFERAREREQAEEALRLQKHLREIEQLRYDRLRSSQEETTCLRHDFQNYLLALRAMQEGETAYVRGDFKHSDSGS